MSLVDVELNTINVDHLKNIPYEDGVNDCYGVCRRFYKDIFNIELRNYARPFEWWNHGLNLYMDNFAKEGFRVMDIPIKDIHLGDCLLIALTSRVPNHCGLYVGQNQILHHPPFRLSRTDPYKSIWRQNTCAILRHRDIVLPEVKTKTIDIMSLLPPHIREKLENAKPS
jgi:cell wall-associated NlpC family hydrolase